MPRRAFLLGKSISDSLSPVLYHTAFQKSGIDAEYDLVDLRDREDLKNFLGKLSETDLDGVILGFNVTAPFKEDIITYLNSIDLRSKSLGAVNTVKVLVQPKKKNLEGFNTDYDGVVASLAKLDALRALASSKSLVLGAGGAARACAYALLDKGCRKVSILNRTPKRALEISEQFTLEFPSSTINAAPLTKENYLKLLEESDLVINAISNADDNAFPLTLEEVNNKRLKLFDLGYKRESLFLKSARNKGLECTDGLLMLVTQAAKSFEIWTGIQAPLKAMKLAAESTLGRTA
jgi:shikimate dehydrogenase